MAKERAGFICSACGADQHKWHAAYYEEGIKLVKAEKSYITWCKNVNRFVLENSNYDKYNFNR